MFQDGLAPISFKMQILNFEIPAAASPKAIFFTSSYY
jgi:hypothetical protein